MKFSVFKGDEGYENYLAHRPIMCHVNGEIVSNVTRADTDGGWIQFNIKGDDGLFIVEGGEIVTGMAEGLVEVTGVGLPIEQPEPDPIPEPIEPEESEEDV